MLAASRVFLVCGDLFFFLFFFGQGPWVGSVLGFFSPPHPPPGEPAPRAATAGASHAQRHPHVRRRLGEDLEGVRPCRPLALPSPVGGEGRVGGRAARR